MTEGPHAETPGDSATSAAGFGRLPRVGRRGVVAGGGVLLTGAMLETTPLGRQVLASLGFGDDPQVAPKVGKPFTGGIRVEQVRRPEDLLVVDLVLVNVATRKIKDRGLYLELADRGKRGFLAVVLPGQNVGETLGRDPETPVSFTALALPSVLAFSLPRDWRVPYDLESLLDWTELKPAWKNKGDDPVSRIEAPYRLKLKPSAPAVWQHAVAPVVRAVGSRTSEVWHTRLVGRPSAAAVPDQRVSRYRTVTVVEALKSKLKLPLKPVHRAQIVAKSATTPVQADRLILSSLGATLELHGRWPDTTGLLAWDHRSTMGRDQYVKTVESGFLAPWGHRAAKVTETWRTMTNHGGETVAVQQQFVTIVLLDALVDTSLAPLRQAGGCGLPFKTVRSTVAVTGRLKDFSPGQVPVLFGTATSLTLPLVGTDWDGREVPFVSRVMWVDANHQGIAAWNAMSFSVRRVDLLGQRTAVATGLNAATTMPVGPVTVQLEPLAASQIAFDSRRARFRPLAETLDVQIPALGALSPTGDSSGTTHVYHPAYLADEDNPGGVVLGLQPGAAARGFGSALPPDRAGGLFEVPSYQGFSRKGGALLASSPGALTDTANGDFEPANVFEDIQLLGGVSLSDIVKKLTPSEGQLAPGLPQLTHQVVNGRQTVRMAIRPTLQFYSFSVAPGVELRFLPGALTVDVEVSTGGTSPAEERLEARLTDSKLQLGGLVVLPIDEMRIASSSGHPLDVTFKVGDVSFLGPLAFVQELAALVTALLGDEATSRSASRAIPLPGPARRGLEPSVDVSPSGVHVGLSLALPDVGVGVFTLSGLGFGLGVEIGLLTPGFAVDFNFATHDDPFVLTYGPFGGGGYVALRMLGGEIENVEISLLVAGGIGVNLGVAAGAITVQAGFVLALPSGKPVAVTAFFRASGSLEVLGLVSLSVVFEIALKFIDTNPTTLAGTATLQLKIKVLCCSKTVKASVSRTFAGGQTGTPVEAGGRPAIGARTTEIDAPPYEPVRFIDTYPDAGQWRQYATAFAGTPDIGAA